MPEAKIHSFNCKILYQYIHESCVEKVMHILLTQLHGLKNDFN